MYEWVDTFTLSQEKCDISKDFSDGGKWRNGILMVVFNSCSVAGRDHCTIQAEIVGFEAV